MTMRSLKGGTVAKDGGAGGSKDCAIKDQDVLGIIIVENRKMSERTRQLCIGSVEYLFSKVIDVAVVKECPLCSSHPGKRRIKMTSPSNYRSLDAVLGTNQTAWVLQLIGVFT